MPTIHDIIHEEYLYNSTSGPGDVWLISSTNVIRDLTKAVDDLRHTASRCEAAVDNIDRIRERIDDKWHVVATVATLKSTDDSEPHIGICATHPDSDLTIEVMFCLGLSRHYWRVWFEGCVLIGPKEYEWANNLTADVVDFIDALGGGI